MPECKKCRKSFHTKKELKIHMKEHDKEEAPVVAEPEPEIEKTEEETKPKAVAKTEEKKAEPFIPEIGMKVWARRPDLQKAFPHPSDPGCSFGGCANFLEWMRKWGVREDAGIANYFKKESEGGN
jgi:hypothetical protein